MIKYLIGFLLLLSPGFAWADYPAVFKEAMFNNSGGNYTYHSPAKTACERATTAAYPPAANASYSDLRFTLLGPANLVSSYQCEIVWKTGAPTITTKDIRFHCPYQPATLNGSICVGTGKPPATCPTPSGEAVTWTQKTGTGGLNDTSATTPSVSFNTYPTTSPLCGLTARPILKSCQSYDVGALRTFTCTFTGISNGIVAPTAEGAPNVGPGGGEAAPATTQPKTGMPPVPVPAGDSKCPTGTVSGGIDSAGRTVCIGTGVDPKNPPAVTPTVISKAPVTTTNPDGSTTVVKETHVTNADGSITVTTESSTTDTAGNVTKTGTSSTSNNSSGGAGQADIEAEKDSFCKQNPNLSICKNSLVTGACEAVACEGDAIQCAVLRSTAALECRDKQDRVDVAALPAKALGDAILSGNDPIKGQIDAAIAGTQVDMSSANLDQSGFVAGSCFGDKTISVLGQSVSVSFASVCEDIQPLRYVIMACALIFSYLLVSRSVLNA